MITDLLLAASGENRMVWAFVGLFVVIIIIGVIASASDNKEKKSSSNSSGDGCWGYVVTAVVFVVIAALMNCKGCSTSGSKGDPGGYWDNYPRHSELVKPIENNVNYYTFLT